MHVSKQILSFLKNLDFEIKLPDEVEVMNPFKDRGTYSICRKFYNKYYNDNHSRHLILGINPGRFGGGITGIPFTDPLRLVSVCRIENAFQKKQELSSVFIYEMIDAFGGPENFYSKFYISSISPLGFTKNNKNLNYYDDRNLELSLREFIIKNIDIQLTFGILRDVAFCLGEGKNFTYLSRLNDEMKFFERVVPLPHPRFIMQYKLKKKHEYIDRYLRELTMN
ncbi:MAG: uracil-DNA glycosylase family protein [Ginsengibacter sp.]